jgi:protein CpxP
MNIRTSLMAATLLFCSLSFAQTAPGLSSEGPGRMHNPAMMQKMQDRMAQRHAQHLEALKSALLIKPEQEGAWTSFASSMQPVNPRPVRPAPAELEKLSTPERIDKMMAFKAQRDAQMQKRADATKAIYASLTTEQKSVFDQHTAKYMNQMGHGGEHGPRSH